MSPRPTILPTTLWDFPSQNYGNRSQGDINFTGATPSYIIWNLVKRYTQKNDLIVDPFCGSGTTLDVAKDLKRKCRGFDIKPRRQDITKADAAALPLKAGSADLLFLDPPYSDHIHYSGEPECLGNISAFDSRFYRKFKQIAAECSRVLKKNKFLTLYICDFFKKKKGFSPTGFKLFKIFSKYFKPIDIIAVTRHNNDLQKNNFRKAAVENNFFLRGFNYLFIFKKPRNRKKYCLNNF